MKITFTLIKGIIESIMPVVETTLQSYTKVKNILKPETTPREGKNTIEISKDSIKVEKEII